MDAPGLLARVRDATPRRGWLSLALFLALSQVLVPLLHLAAPAGSALHLGDHWVALGGKIACYALVAVALDLIWGYAGILSLGHGLFFALGGYAFGMYLMRAIGRDGVYQADLPDFMVFLDWKALPWFWRGTEHPLWALLLALAVPALLAAVFGLFAFRSRIRGVYLSIITQALTYAAMLLFYRNETGFGGNNGFTDFKRILGFPIAAPGTRVALFMCSTAALALALVLCRWLVTSRFGRVLTAIRDGEARVMALGYEPTRYKLLAWTVSAALCGLAGALYVPQVGIINPSEMSPAASIEIAIAVAVGGRGTLVGAALGALIVNGARSWFTVAAPEAWPYVLGLLFIAVTRWLPDGVLGALGRLWAARRPRQPAPAAVPGAPAERGQEATT
ncbi:MAG: urea ABC transporter permease subunit UrtC [Anaeromyxobacter sp.]